MDTQQDILTEPTAEQISADFASPTAQVLGVSDLHAAKEAFVIDTEDNVNWYLRKLANIEAEKARVKAQSALINARLDADAQGLEVRFGSQVEAFARAKVEGTRRKSYPTLQGTLAFRTVPASLKIGDEDAAFAFAQKYAVCLDLTPRLDAAKYREHARILLADSGELIPGVERIDAREAFSVSFGKSKDAPE